MLAIFTLIFLIFNQNESVPKNSFGNGRRSVKFTFEKVSICFHCIKKRMNNDSAIIKENLILGNHEILTIYEKIVARMGVKCLEKMTESEEEENNERLKETKILDWINCQETWTKLNYSKIKNQKLILNLTNDEALFLNVVQEYIQDYNQTKSVFLIKNAYNKTIHVKQENLNSTSNQSIQINYINNTNYSNPVDNKSSDVIIHTIWGLILSLFVFIIYLCFKK